MTDYNRIRSSSAMQAATECLAKQDQRMAELVGRFGPVDYQPWQQDLFTALISSIISQQLSIKAAATILGRVKKLVAAEDVISAAMLVQQQPDALRGAGLSNAKVKYVLGLAEAVVAGDLDFKSLDICTDNEIKDRLVGYSGVGYWTAEMFLMFAIGAPDVLATADLGLKRGMKVFLGLDDYPSEEVFIQEAEIWRPYRSIASWYLWRLAE
ncbi:MAG: DNA-3-methyladenine glycosylase 2 family protein [Gammaproteobacteria bacterium]|nr:DNA-3-methyladenine glycosylase 2 family protein [Gammaproteobacteria bacterium]NNJ72449.1 DNA-3-methyladenine glycosylase 2 family protein [Enterobacterales bacterium]